ncbi:MAG: methyltransferase family protein [Candidatus Methylomirabilota bacterium]
MTRVLSPLGNVLIALFYSLFLRSAIAFWVETGSVVGLGLVLFNSLIVTCLLVRRRAVAVTGSVTNWILAMLVQLIPLLLRPIGSASELLAVVSAGGQLAGLAIMVASLLVLNRSFGILAANRGITSRGLYALVRHPLYTGEMVFFISFLTANWSFQNAYLVGVLILIQVVRSFQEEMFLLRDQHYAKYRAAVAYRFIPRIL